MTDPDLIAEGQRLLAAANPGPYAVLDDNGAFAHLQSLYRIEKDGWRERIASNMQSANAEWAAWLLNNGPVLLDGLETARARVAELEGERPAIDEALERAYDAEGYVDTLAEILSEGAAPLTWDEAVMGTDRKTPVLPPRHGLLAAARAALVDRDAARARVAELETVAIELLAAHRRMAELEATVTGLDKDRHAAYEREIDAVMRAEKAELAQRPPLGYVVLAKSRAVDGAWRYHVSSASRVQQSAEDAARLRAMPSDEYVYVVAEVREVQP